MPTADFVFVVTHSNPNVNEVLCVTKTLSRARERLIQEMANQDIPLETLAYEGDGMCPYGPAGDLIAGCMDDTVTFELSFMPDRHPSGCLYPDDTHFMIQRVLLEE